MSDFLKKAIDHIDTEANNASVWTSGWSSEKGGG